MADLLDQVLPSREVAEEIGHAAGLSSEGARIYSDTLHPHPTRRRRLTPGMYIAQRIAPEIRDASKRIIANVIHLPIILKQLARVILPIR